MLCPVEKVCFKLTNNNNIIACSCWSCWSCRVSRYRVMTATYAWWTRTIRLQDPQPPTSALQPPTSALQPPTSSLLAKLRMHTAILGHLLCTGQGTSRRVTLLLMSTRIAVSRKLFAVRIALLEFGYKLCAILT